MTPMPLTYVLEKCLNINISDGEHGNVHNFPSRDMTKNGVNDFFAMCQLIFVTVLAVFAFETSFFSPQVEIHQIKSFGHKAKVFELVYNNP